MTAVAGGQSVIRKILQNFQRTRNLFPKNDNLDPILKGGLKLPGFKFAGFTHICDDSHFHENNT